MNPFDATVRMYELLGACLDDEDQEEYVRCCEAVGDGDENDSPFRCPGDSQSP